jgi:hypothetical protein
MVTVAQKLSAMEEGLQEQGCWFHTGDNRNKGYNSDKLTWA